jgi:hypothetical protein
VDQRFVSSSFAPPAADHLVVVSPHLDDAVLSGWSWLRAARRATVITVCAGIAVAPPADYDRLTRSDDPEARCIARREEDRAVLAGHGWTPVHLDILDAPYRTPATTPTPAAVAEQIAARFPTDATHLLINAGIGCHEDHLLARDAALRLDRAGLEANVMADYPYAAVYGWPGWVTGDPDPAYLAPETDWDRAIRDLRPLLGQPRVVALSEAEQAAKLAAFDGYASQVPATEAGPSRQVSHPRRIGWEVSWPLRG